MNHPDSLAAYIDGIAELRRAVDGLTPQELQARPVPGKWSTLEVVCHLADSEALFAERMKRVLAEDRPALQFADPVCFVTALVYQQRDLQEELVCIEAVRRQLARILRAQSAAAWQRVGIHSRQGEQTLEQLLQKAVDHFAHHVAFIAEKRATLRAIPSAPPNT